jgi:hypothetical protein
VFTFKKSLNIKMFRKKQTKKPKKKRETKKKTTRNRVKTVNRLLIGPANCAQRCRCGALLHA